MKLISCYIENFGKIQNYNCRFRDDLAVIHKENGWGKSTLAAYIRVMFYGFSGEGKRNATENERKKYAPWQMGTYGGNLVFEAGGKEYRLERYFGDKKSGSDRFELYDNRTNLKSDDFSSNIGEELFGIDLESFMRTVFIAQQDCGTDVTADINAKIGNVSDQTADMGNYDQVMARLKKETDALTPDRKTGELKKLEQDIAEKTEKVRGKGQLEESIRELTKKIAGQDEEKKDLQNELKTVQKDIEKLSALKDASTEIEQYRNLCEQERAASDKYAEKKAFFRERIPRKEETEEAAGKNEEYEFNRQELKTLELTENEEERFRELSGSFAGGIPDDGVFEEIGEKTRLLSKLKTDIQNSGLSDPEKEKFDAIKERFRMYTPDAAGIDALSNKWVERADRKERTSAKKAGAELFRKEHAPKKGSAGILAVILFVITGLFIAAGVILYVSTWDLVIPGICLVAAAAALISAILLLLKKGKDRKAQEKADAEYENMMREIRDEEEAIRRVDLECLDLFEKLGMEYQEAYVQASLAEIRGLVKDYEELAERDRAASESGLKEAAADTEAELRRILGNYGIREEDPDLSKAIFRLKDEASEYEKLAERKQKYDSLKRKVETAEKELSGYIRSLGFSAEGSFKDRLQEIGNALSETEYLRTELDERTKKRQEFEASHDISELEEKKAVLGSSASMEDLNGSFNRIRERIEEIASYEKQLSDQLDAAMEKAEEMENFEAELAALEEKRKQALEKYRILCRTRDYLEQAKVNFSGKYMDEIKESFEKYRSIISDTPEQYELDANLNISLKEKGSLHPIGTLSEGYQDLVGLCRRMAMVDAMYDKEKPFLIFDDPFVNLDESRLQGAMKFLNRLSEDYQIIYFSCHQSRCC